MPHLPAPPDASGFLPPPLARALVTAHHIVETRLNHLLDPACTRDTLPHDLHAFHTLVRITKTVEDFYARHPDRRPAAPEPPNEPNDLTPEPSLVGRVSDPIPVAVPPTPADPPSPSTLSIASTPSNPSSPFALSAPSAGVPPSSDVPSSPFALFAPLAVNSSASSSASVPSYADLLTPSLARRLDHTACALEAALPVHLHTRGLDRPRLFPADVDRLAALVSVHVTLAEVAARAASLPPRPADPLRPTAWPWLEPYLAFTLDAAAIGSDPYDPDAEFEAAGRQLEAQRLNHLRRLDAGEPPLHEPLHAIGPDFLAFNAPADLFSPAASNAAAPPVASDRSPKAPTAAPAKPSGKAAQPLHLPSPTSLSGIWIRSSAPPDAPAPSTASTGSTLSIASVSHLHPDPEATYAARPEFLPIPAKTGLPAASSDSALSRSSRSSRPSSLSLHSLVAAAHASLEALRRNGPSALRPSILNDLPPDAPLYTLTAATFTAPPASHRSHSSPSSNASASRKPTPHIRILDPVPFFPRRFLSFLRCFPIDPSDPTSRAADVAAHRVRYYVLGAVQCLIARVLASLDDPRRPRFHSNRPRPPDPWVPRYA